MEPDTQLNVLFSVLCLAALIGYFIPTFVAYGISHKYKLPIFIANIFFGVTVVGWAALLIFAILKEFRMEESD